MRRITMNPSTVAAVLLFLPAVILAPLILNLIQWRGDLRRLRELTAARNGDAPAKYDHAQPRVSFLVAAWNEESRVRRCIEAILRLSYRNLEIVLCAGGADRTWEAASELSDARLILLEQHAGDGKQKSLRRCMEKASGDIVYLLDADCVVTEESFARMIRAILSGAEQAVTCFPYRPIAEQLDSPFVLNQCACRTYTSVRNGGYGTGLSGANTIIAGKALERAGGFDSSVGAGGDYDLGKRLLESGTRIRHDIDAPVAMEYHSGLRQYLGQQARWLRNVVVHGLRYRAHGEVVRSLFTSLLGLGMLCIPCIWAVPGIPPEMLTASALAWTAAFLHALLSRLRYLKLASTWLGIRFPLRAIAMAPAFLVIDFVAWAIPLGQYPVKALRETW